MSTGKSIEINVDGTVTHQSVFNNVRKLILLRNIGARGELSSYSYGSMMTSPLLGSPIMLYKGDATIAIDL